MYILRPFVTTLFFCIATHHDPVSALPFYPLLVTPFMVRLVAFHSSSAPFRCFPSLPRARWRCCCCSLLVQSNTLCAIPLCFSPVLLALIQSWCCLRPLRKIRCDLCENVNHACGFQFPPTAENSRCNEVYVTDRMVTHRHHVVS